MNELPSTNSKEYSKTIRYESYELIKNSRRLRSNIITLLKVSPAMEYPRETSRFSGLGTNQRILTSKTISLDLNSVPRSGPIKLHHPIFNSQAVRNLTLRRKNPEQASSFFNRSYSINARKRRDAPMIVESIENTSKSMILPDNLSPILSPKSICQMPKSKLKLRVHVPFPQYHSLSPDYKS
ncbi:unnamed protein product [Blepharisma stoltei]|uniref:Uncharacterized protein n=1 Tax=Blepharisma stoltei TaxID=1481888 RepID=A0AAU9JHH0_9CILI|nr:unnamed protein product [Blepharisma stoltei]